MTENLFDDASVKASFDLFVKNLKLNPDKMEQLKTQGEKNKNYDPRCDPFSSVFNVIDRIKQHKEDGIDLDMERDPQIDLVDSGMFVFIFLFCFVI